MSALTSQPIDELSYWIIRLAANCIKLCHLGFERLWLQVSYPNPGTHTPPAIAAPVYADWLTDDHYHSQHCYTISTGTTDVSVYQLRTQALHSRLCLAALETKSRTESLGSRLVQSYGAVMYEIWSLGHKSFEGYTNPQVMMHGVILHEQAHTSE